MCRRWVRARTGQSLLELILATTLIALAVVPALRLLRDSMTVSREWESQCLISSYGVSLLEERLAKAIADWKVEVATGDFSAQGHADVNYQVVQSDLVSVGGVPDELMVITATVWVDENGNDSADSGEPIATYATKISKLGAYPGAP